MHKYLNSFFWGGVMADKGIAESECDKYIQSIPIPDRVQKAMPLLFKPLSLDLVQTALERLPKGSSPGKDGILSELYQLMGNIFAPKLLEVMQVFVQESKEE